LTEENAPQLRPKQKRRNSREKTLSWALLCIRRCHAKHAIYSRSPIRLAYSPGDVKTADLNGDGIPDLGVTSSEKDAVDIFLGDGSGRFKLAPGSPFTVSESTEFNTHLLQLVDINEDGKTDVVTAGNQQQGFSVLLGDGAGTFKPGLPVKFSAGSGRYSFAFGDLDGDKHLDIVVTNTGDDFDPDHTNAVILYGDGKGAFRNSSPNPVPPAVHYTAIGDLNGDQRADIVLTHKNNLLSVLLNQGGRNFKLGSTHTMNSEGFAVAVVDVNGDRLNDLVVAAVDSLTVMLNTKSGLVLAQGDPLRAGPGAYHFAVGDVNRDGKSDVALSSFEGKAVTVLLGR
jgi:VCBS repeat protein